MVPTDYEKVAWIAGDIQAISRAVAEYRLTIWINDMTVQTDTCAKYGEFLVDEVVTTIDPENIVLSMGEFYLRILLKIIGNTDREISAQQRVDQNDIAQHEGEYSTSNLEG
jgi:hypothetical protein